MLLRYNKGRFSVYLSVVMLISRKVTKDKRVVTDFRHLNVRKAKNNLAYPLLKDTFSVLSSSRCEVLSVLDLKDTFHPLRFWKIQKDTVKSYHTLVAPHFFISRNAYGIEYISINFAVTYKCNIRLFTN